QRVRQEGRLVNHIVALLHRGLGFTRELRRIARGADLRDSPAVRFQRREELRFVRDPLLLDQRGRLVVLRARKRRDEIGEPECRQMLAFEEADEVACREERSGAIFLHRRRYTCSASSGTSSVRGIVSIGSSTSISRSSGTAFKSLKRRADTSTRVSIEATAL